MVTILYIVYTVYVDIFHDEKLKHFRDGKYPQQFRKQYLIFISNNEFQTGYINVLIYISTCI